MVGERGNLPGMLQANTKLSSTSLKITKNINEKKPFIYMKHRESGKILFGTLLFRVLQYFFQDIFAVLPFAFSMFTSHV